MYNRFAETEAPKPTHVIFRAPGVEETFDINNWRGQNEIPTTIPNGTVGSLEWILKDNNTVMYLGASPIVVKGV